MSEMRFADAYAIADFIKQAEKSTPVKLYIKGPLETLDLRNVRFFGSDHSGVIFGDIKTVKPWLEAHQNKLEDMVLECDRRNSAIPLLDITQVQARIEPGAYIREHAIIGAQAVIMMGAVINIGAVVGEGTMIDMNAVLGARATIGKRCHIGAGAVVAGVLEPPSKLPVIIEDDVLVGANAVILEGVRVKAGAVVAAGSIVTQDVEANTVVGGVPARFLKYKDDKTSEKTHILDALRG